MSTTFRTAIEKAVAVVIGLMGIELLLRTIFSLSLAAMLTRHISH